MKIGFIDVGGGLRGIYAAGVFDYCIENEIKFDYGIGISAGSANLASYMSGQKGRNRLYYRDYSQRWQYMGWRDFFFRHSFIDLDYVYGTLSNAGGENPLDYAKMAANPMEWHIQATDARTGEPHMFGPDDIAQDNYDVLKASCSIPFACPARMIKGVPYYDGALGDPIPLKRAFADGCDKVVLILTKPVDTVDSPATDNHLAALIAGKYPVAAERLRTCVERYGEGIRLAQEYAREGKVLIVAPDDICGVKTLTRDKELLDRLYRKGYEDGKAIPDFMADEMPAEGTPSAVGKR